MLHPACCRRPSPSDTLNNYIHQTSSECPPACQCQPYQENMCDFFAIVCVTRKKPQKVCVVRAVLSDSELVVMTLSQSGHGASQDTEPVRTWSHSRHGASHDMEPVMTLIQSEHGASYGAQPFKSARSVKSQGGPGCGESYLV